MTGMALETARLTLRRLTEGDAGFLLELLNDPDFVRNIGDRGVRTRADARRYLRRGALASYRRLGFGHYLVAARGSGEAIGICGLARREPLSDPDLGFAFLPAHRGRGYAAEASAAVLEEAREAHGLARVLAVALPDNRPSVRVLEKLGFRREGSVRWPGEETDLALFARELGASPARAGDEGLPGAAKSGRSGRKEEVAMEVVNLEQKLSRITAHWDPKIVGELNGQHVKLVKFRGPFVWHRHEAEDELFLVLHGAFEMEYRERTVTVRAGEFVIVPRGVEHRPVAAEEVHVLLFEPAGTLNTGDAGGPRTVAAPERI